MTIFNAIILGLIQGIAEFFPISSSGHLSILNNLFDVVTVTDGHMLYDSMLKLGTLAAVFVMYWQDIAQMTNEVRALAGRGPLAGQRSRRLYARLFLMLVLATLPLFIVLPVKRLIDNLYYRNIFVGIELILTGCILYVSDRMLPGKKTERNMTVFDALIIGICQSAATIPGLSRTGTTVTAGIATGLRADFALKFSFLLSLPALLGADVISLIQAMKQGIDIHNVPAYLIGMLSAMLSGMAAIAIMKKLFKNGKFNGFSYYCLIIGVLSIILTIIF